MRHRWARQEGWIYWCEACGKTMRSLSARLTTGHCKGKATASGLAVALLSRGLHRLAAVFPRTGLPGIACLACGSYADKRPLKLLRPCTGTPTQAGRRCLFLLSRGGHPHGRGMVDAVLHKQGGEVASTAVQFNS